MTADEYIRWRCDNWLTGKSRGEPIGDSYGEDQWLQDMVGLVIDDADNYLHDVIRDAIIEWMSDVNVLANHKSHTEGLVNASQPGNVTDTPRKGTIMGFELTIDSESEAFCRDGHLEVARLLRQVADRLEGSDESGRLYDVYGNHVGSWEWQAPVRTFNVTVEFTVFATNEEEAEAVVSNELGMGAIAHDQIEDVQIDGVREA